MTVVDKIIFDKEWNRTMTQIDRLSFTPGAEVSFECLHGYSHAFAVGRYAVNILRQLESDEHELLLGEVSGLVHDISLIDGKKNHAQRGAEKSKELLSRLGGLSENDINLVSHAISTHSDGEYITNDLDLALLVADKLDVTRDRLAVTDGNLSKELNKIDDVSVEITDNNFLLKYETEPDFDKMAIRDWDKMITIPQKAAQYLALEFQFTINSENVDLEFLK